MLKTVYPTKTMFCEGVWGGGYKNQQIRNETVLHGSLLTDMIAFIIKISSLIMQAAIKIHSMCVHCGEGGKLKLWGAS